MTPLFNDSVVGSLSPSLPGPPRISWVQTHWSSVVRGHIQAHWPWFTSRPDSLLIRGSTRRAWLENQRTGSGVRAGQRVNPEPFLSHTGWLGLGPLTTNEHSLLITCVFLCRPQMLNQWRICDAYHCQVRQRGFKLVAAWKKQTVLNWTNPECSAACLYWALGLKLNLCGNRSARIHVLDHWLNKTDKLPISFRKYQILSFGQQEPPKLVVKRLKKNWLLCWN